MQADHAYTMEARAEVQAVLANSQVRRLTPRECEWLQGFPGDHTRIPYRGKPADKCPDGPGYNGVPWRVFARYQGSVTERSERYNPWSDWALSGPLMEANNVSIHCPQHDTGCWAAWITKDGKDVVHGGRVLPAACRAIVAATLGDNVRVPKELYSNC
ncbi:phage protein NinX family protein [Pseudomonas sichuanensis]|uniref:phage protein NinX family protein n=1 Tax=Pseudomonas sichuanensis TaxID=2213015 RepID=UPI003CC6ABE5